MKKIQENSTVRYLGGNKTYDTVVKKGEIYTVDGTMDIDEKDYPIVENVPLPDDWKTVPKLLMSFTELPNIKATPTHTYKHGFNPEFFEIIFEDSESIWDKLAELDENND